MSHFRAAVFLLSLALSSSALAELKVYDVEEKYRQEVFSALRGILSSERLRSSSAGGTVEMLPTGQILIDATPERHAEVAAVLQAISEHQAEPAPQVRLRYWAVLGSPGAGSTATPEILDDVLDEIRSVHGPLSFQVLGNATLVTESGQAGDLNGDTLAVSQETFVQDAMLNADLTIRFEYVVPTVQFNTENGNPFRAIARAAQSVQLNVTMEPDEFLVVAENVISGTGQASTELAGTIFYIVHWPASE